MNLSNFKKSHIQTVHNLTPECNFSKLLVQ
jgi:hypothetical protein